MSYNVEFYIPLERTQEEARINCLAKLNQLLESSKAITFDEPFHLFNGELLTPEIKENWIKVFERQIRRVKNGFCSKAIWNNQLEDYEIDTIDDKHYIVSSEYSNSFRIWKCPSEIFTSYESIKDYIEENIEKIYLYKDSFKKLEEFFNKYPNGFIKVI